MKPYSILAVCMGNICRSPAAEGLFRKRAAERGMKVRLDSAGTGGWHVGAPPDARMQQAAASRGLDLTDLSARRVEAADFFEFDLILAMDKNNFADLKKIQPEGGRAKLDMMMGPVGGGVVPDPYHGGQEGFDRVLDLLNIACDAWLDRIPRADAA